jgi:uncharacterized protein
LFRILAPAGIFGGVTGTYLLTAVNGAVFRPYLAAYLGLMGVCIRYRSVRRAPDARTDDRPIPHGGLS